MNKRKWIAASLAVVIGLGGSTYSASSVHQVAAAETEIQSNFNITADVSAQVSQLDHFEQIKGFFAGAETDLSQVKQYYEANLQADVQQRDALTDEQISAMLQLGVEGSAITGQLKQAVDKGLQWFFYNEIRHFDREAGNALAEGDTDLANVNLDKAITLFENTIHVTAGKRDNDFGTLTQDFFENIALPGMRTAIDSGDETAYHVWRQYFEKTMMKVFTQATIRYANKVPIDYANGDTEALMAHLAEGYFFFMPIHDYLVTGNQEAADQIRDAFASGDGANVNPNEIQAWLTQAITAKVNGYIDAAVDQDLAAGNLDKARIHAAEGNAFASQLEVIIKQELGSEAYTQLQLEGEQFFNAVKANQSEEAEVHGKAVKDLLSQLSGNQLAHFEQVKGFFSAEEPDLSQVKAYYEENIQPLVQARNTQIDEEISFILEAGVNGQAIPGQVKQAIDKGLQWYFYDEINQIVRHEAGAALSEGNIEEAKQALDKALILFNGSVYVTSGKRDNDFSTLTQDFFDNIAVPGLKQAIEDGDATAFNVFRQYFQKTMMKVFVLATSKYAAKVPADHEAGKTADEKAHLAEGYFFFMPIHEYLSSGSQEAADQIKQAFGSGDGAAMNAEQVKTWLARAISAKVNGYAGATINKDLASGNLDNARIHAAEGNAFASQLEIILNERLGADAYTELQTYGQNYSEAVDANDSAGARKHAFAVLKLLSNISGVHFEIGDKTLNVMGQAETHEEFTSYVDPSTDRSVASVRFISQALAAEVDWAAADKKVTITKGSTTIELIAGSTDVFVNGQLNEEYTLDQPVKIEDGRTYIPLRAAVELLGGTVFWHDGEVVINY